jgi:uncharacterized membrane protein YidH (DUF202 family)
MSFTDKLVLWLHIGFAIFALGPVTIAVLSTPRYIRARNQVVVSYLLRTTRIYALVSLGVLVFGVVSAQQRKDFSHPWLTIAMTLFIVSLVLLLLIMRDQRHAVTALELAAAAEAPAVGGPAARVAGAAGAVPDAAEEAATDAAVAGERAPAPAGTPGSPGTPGAEPNPVASVERGRIATMGGVTALLYLVILVLMVWR